jgi:hypothetical protein
MVRPRSEVMRDGRTRIAHAKVERGDLRPDKPIQTPPAPLGRGYLLPVRILPLSRFRKDLRAIARRLSACRRRYGSCNTGHPQRTLSVRTATRGKA